MTSTGATGAWYALSVRARCEHSAARDVAARVDEVFLPARRERRAWSDRVVTHDLPLFPGYVFVRAPLTAERRVAILRSRFVHEIVGVTNASGGGAAGAVARAVPTREIEALRIAVAADRALDPVERLVSGRHVLVATGALRGAYGVVEHGPDGRRRLIIRITLLGRGVRAVLSADDVVETLGDDDDSVSPRPL